MLLWSFGVLHKGHLRASLLTDLEDYMTFKYGPLCHICYNPNILCKIVQFYWDML